MIETKIEPALTAKEWRDAKEWAHFVPGIPVQEWAAVIKHPTAALCLLGQPFGFTDKDVDLLRELARDPEGVTYRETCDEELQALESIADRIAALLPPQEEA